MTHRHHKHATLENAVAGQLNTPPKGTVVSCDNCNGILASETDIRLCAYQKWEAAGQPAGDGAEFWLQAEKELGEGKNERSGQQVGWSGHHEHERPEAQKGGNESDVSVDGHDRDNNRMFQNHGERGHRHGSR
jgi:Protein of unknown function (DUF2934)